MTRILLADDQRDVLEALRILFKGEGYQTDAVTSLAAVFSALEKKDYALLIMDLNYTRDTTSGQEGLAAIPKIQEIDNTLPIVVMTAWATIDLAVDAMKRGARDFRFINLAFALRGKIRASAHRKSRGEHPRQTGYEHIMLLVIGRTRDTRNNSKDCAQSIICTVDRVGYPTAPASMPALTFQNCIERCARTRRRRHRAERSGVRLFLKRTFAQKILHIIFTGQRALCLIPKLRLVPLFCSFHPADSNLRAGDFVPPPVQPAADRVLENRRRNAEVFQLLFPALRMSFFRFCHAQEDAFAFFIPLTPGEIAIRLCRLDFRAPIALDHFDRLLCS